MLHYNDSFVCRNLSSAGADVRQAMRECENLIDSLIYYIQGTVANQNTDDEVKLRGVYTMTEILTNKNLCFTLVKCTCWTSLLSWNWVTFFFFFYLIFFKATENCVCILHNLTFQFCPEIPQQHTQLPRGSRENPPPEQTGVGCFSHRSAKITQVIPGLRNPPLMVQKIPPLVSYCLRSMFINHA